MEGGTEEITMTYPADGGVGFGEDYIAAVENSVYTDTVWRIRTAMITMQTPHAAREELGFIRNAYKFFQNWPILGTMLSGQMDVLIVSIPDIWFDQIQITDEAVLGKGYECGYVVYDGGNTGGITDSEGKPYPFAHFSTGDTVQLGNGSYQIIASHVLSPTNHITRWIEADLYRAILYMPESAFLAEFGDGPSKRCTSVNLTYALLVNAKEGCYDLLRTELEKCSENVTVSIDETTLTRHLTEAENSGASALETLSYSADIGGRMDGLEQMKQTVLAIQTVGYSLAAMIFLIGTLNIINTALSSVSEQKREFAMLEAVGMTDKQMRRMLLTESLYSSGVAVLLTVCVGFPLISVIIHTAMDGLVSLHWLSGILMIAVCMMVSILSGIAVFRLTKSTAVVKRIKVES